MELIPLDLSAVKKEDFDLIVCGGGIAGCAAALEGARQGLKTLLIEKTCLLGGLATIGLVNYFVPMCNHRGKQICRGMAEEFMRLSIRYGYDTLPEDWRNGEPDEPTSSICQTQYDPLLFAMELCGLLTDEGVRILFDVSASWPVMDGKRCAGIVADSEEGFTFYGARQVIDATGDAGIAAKAGMPTADGKNYFSYFPRVITTDSCREAAESGRINRAVRTIAGGAANLYGGGQPADVPFYWGASADGKSDYLIRNQKIVCEKLEKDADRFSRMLVMTPMMPQYRCIRRIEGDSTLREEDVYRHFADSLCAVNDFDHADYLYEIPRSAMTKRGFDNLIACGRCISADGYAWDIVRVIPPAILTGQAAAVCASHAVRENRALSDTELAPLQSALEAKDVIVHFDDALVPPDADRTFTYRNKL